MNLRFQVKIDTCFKYDFSELHYVDLTYHGNNVIDIVYDIPENYRDVLGVLKVYDVKDEYEITFTGHTTILAGNPAYPAAAVERMVSEIKMDFC
jgi:hypothetical protein